MYGLRRAVEFGGGAMREYFERLAVVGKSASDEIHELHLYNFHFLINIQLQNVLLQKNLPLVLFRNPIFVLQSYLSHVSGMVFHQL